MIEEVERHREKKKNIQWKNSEILSVLLDDSFEKFFENYKKFDELWLLVSKNKQALIYSENVLLDGEVSWRLHEEFYEAFLNSIKSIVGEDIFHRIMWSFFEEKDYLLSNSAKMHDNDPFLDDKFQIFLLWDQTIAQFIERRNSFNNVEFHYIVYPERILTFISKLIKDHNIKI